jgi:hypothetical protein
MTFHECFVDSIKKQKEKEAKNDIWKDSPYKDIIKLKNNNSGIVGEQIIHIFCKSNGIEGECNGVKTKKTGGGDGDGVIMNNSLEVKLAHQGSSNKSFQHELGEVPWNADYMAFIDVSPKCIFLTIFKNFGQKTYKDGLKLESIFPTRSITWRKKKGAFKLDTTIKINETNVEQGRAIKITSETSDDDIASYIKKRIENN